MISAKGNFQRQFFSHWGTVYLAIIFVLWYVPKVQEGLLSGPEIGFGKTLFLLRSYRFGLALLFLSSLVICFGTHNRFGDYSTYIHIKRNSSKIQLFRLFANLVRYCSAFLASSCFLFLLLLLVPSLQGEEPGCLLLPSVKHTCDIYYIQYTKELQ